MFLKYSTVSDREDDTTIEDSRKYEILVVVVVVVVLGICRSPTLSRTHFSTNTIIGVAEEYSQILYIAITLLLLLIDEY